MGVGRHPRDACAAVAHTHGRVAGHACEPRVSCAQALTADEETLAKFYEAWAFVRSSEDALRKMIAVLSPLGAYAYALSLDYETSRWDLH